MKSKKNLLEQLKLLPHFSKDSLYQLGKQLGLADATVDTYISRFLKYKEIYQLKNGLYVSTDFFNKNRTDISYSFYLANIIRTPSYVSSWSALQFYNLTTEAIRSVISVTPKVTRNYKTKAGNFDYQSINKNLFGNFILKRGKIASVELPLLSESKVRFDFFIASPAKALFDLLYFRTRQFRGVELKNIKDVIDDLRIDFDEMDNKERDQFHIMIKRHINNE
ncbi:MAG: hypothetical protein HQL27_02465 [Candidatus Omnitrophica bacterium]|nr:hypothetical protein [Candidatus Omnitrophota bacterium]